jgi:hypothetical protein
MSQGSGYIPRSLIAASLIIAITLALYSSAIGSTDDNAKSVATSELPRFDDAAEYASPRQEFLAIADRIENSPNPFLGQGELPSLLERVDDPRVPPRERVQVRLSLSTEYLRLGNIDEALAQINSAIADGDELGVEGLERAELFRMRALVHLRQAEVENCVERHNSDCCIFPLQGGAIHSVREPALAAKEDLLTYLDLVPRPAPDLAQMQRTLMAVWLLNIVCMALDEYPSGVPPQYALPEHAFKSDADIGRFVDVASQLGVDAFDLAGGVIVDDFDNDGLLDIVTSTCDLRGPMKAYRNVGDGTFEDTAAKRQLDEQLGGLNIVSTDYNNDGLLDIMVLRGAWLFDTGEIRNSLLRHNADGTFTDVTREAGVLVPIAPTQTAVWADFDNDGWLDVYIGNESQTEVEQAGSAYFSTLFRNNRDGTFTDITASAGVENDRYCKGVAAGDFDNDGDMDLYVSNVGRNRLYRNDGNMHFTDVADQARVAEPVGRSFATWFFDFDNDGWLDVWVAGYDGTTSALAANAMGLKDRAERPRLYRNNGDGTFTDMAIQMGLDRPFLPMGANFGDFDNDGWLDIYLGTGDPAYESLMPNIALRNDAGKRFQDVTQSAGLGHLQKGHGIGFADIDHDGDQDIYHQLGAFFPGDAFRNALFKNPGHGHHFITIELVGTKTNRMAYGARIKVVVDTPDGERELHRAPGCVSSFGGSPRRQEIGLAGASAIKSIEIWWPKSGIRQTFTDVPRDGFIRITEGEDAIESLIPAKLELGNAVVQTGVE